MEINFNKDPGNSTSFIDLLTKIALPLGVMFGSGLVYGVIQTTPAQSAFCQVGLVEYEQLKPGMSLTEVRAILSCRGTEYSSSATKATFGWKNSNGSEIITYFEGNKLKSKKQLELL